MNHQNDTPGDTKKPDDDMVATVVEAAASVIPSVLQKATSFSLETPIERGSMRITTISMRRPVGRDLRGLSLALLSQMDVEQVAKLLPRISTPSITEDEAESMDIADVMKAASVVLGFLFPKQASDLQSLLT